MRLNDPSWIFPEIEQELESARAKFQAFNSAHEGYAVLLEEVHELWDEVRHKKSSVEKMREEAIQIAAMAVRFVWDVCNEDS